MNKLCGWDLITATFFRTGSSSESYINEFTVYSEPVILKQNILWPHSKVWNMFCDHNLKHKFFTCNRNHVQRAVINSSQFKAKHEENVITLI
jgi:hypothetical protein